MQSLIAPALGGETGLPLPIPISAPRLVLRRLRESDLDELKEVLGDDRMYRYVSDVPIDENGILHWLEGDARAQLAVGGQGVSLGLESRETRKLAGYVTLMMEDSRQAWVTVFVMCAEQGKGLGTEAVAVLLDFCFSAISLHRVAAACDARNLAALRVLEKVGMRREGKFLQNRFQYGEWADTVYYALLDKEYRESQTVAGENPV